MDLDLRGKTALVTGGGTGIGRAIALALAREGAHVAIASRNPPESTVREIEALGVRALCLRVDVSDERAVVRMVGDAIEGFGALDIFVGHAGSHWHEPVSKITTENWLRTIHTNVSASIWACREAVRHMVPRRQGSILLTISTIQFNPGYMESAYRASKVALKAYAETLALEMAPHGIRVNTISPGIVLTGGATNVKAVLADPVRGSALLASIPIGRLGRPDDCASAALLLLSDRASPYTTGTDVVIDGGWKLRPLTLVPQDEIAAMNL